ncbi:RHS repeat-associated core domain-containing protein [Streptomyces sp. NPDC059101]|uniref:RHS repeat-associated core domain-containing protein n=1 Tax=Streptomyces sp. NPDC059101 TaxID=3346728 RepID=UPI0036C59817
MSSISQLFTHANNFDSAVSGGVDPRTGLFNVRITLGHLVANRNLGPSLPLELSYSPLTRTDMGFGQGVSLGLTTYDTERRLLLLSAGGQYLVQETDTKVIPLQNKLDTVHIAKDQDAYRIAHKSGSVEILTGPQNAFSLKVPTAVLTPAGHHVTLKWDFTTGPQPRLTEIRDEHDTLLKVEYAGTSKATLHVLPDSRDEGYRVDLRCRNGLLGSVHHFGLGQDTPLVWDFAHTSIGDHGEWGPWITGVTMPGGMSETAYYRNDGQGHQFPAAARLPSLPYVYRCVQAPGGGQPPIEAAYSYTDTNFLGGHSNEAWDDDKDNLYDILTDYTYGSTEERVCAGQTTRITRTYNHFHLQTAENTQQNGCSHHVQTEYYAVVGLPFERQKPQFQLPKKHTVTWIDPQGNHRSETTETQFDEAGNPTLRIDPDGTKPGNGTKTEWEYYPPEGSGEDCPPDPNGFTRLLKSVTHTPPAVLDPDLKAPVYKTTYRYTLYTPQDQGVSKAVLKTEESNYADKQLLKRETLTYNTTSHDEFGRVTKFVDTEYPNGSNNASYPASHSFTFKVEGDALVQSHLLTTHDALTVTRVHKRSRFTGRLWSTTDAQGNVTDQTYDGLGRTLTQTVNPGTDYEAKQTRSYTMSEGNAPFTATAIDALGNQVRDSFDGAGRRIMQERKDIDGDGTWYELQKLNYDEQGKVSSISASDYVDKNNHFALQQTFTYDDWGQVETTAFSDGASHLTQTDPIQQTTTTQLLGHDTKVSGTVVTKHNTRGEPVRVERFDLKQESVSVRVLDRDGWGRLRRETDELGHKTLYEYDTRGRLVQTALPDGTQITRDHAPFSPTDLVTGLAVDKTPYGAQSFDGLGRLTTTTSGGRTWSYEYDKPDTHLSAKSPFPFRAKMPDKKDRTYEYHPQLGNALARCQAGSLVQTFTYDKVSGLLAEADDGNATVTRKPFRSGRLQTDITKLAGQSDRTAHTTYTVGGLEKTYTGVDNTTQQIIRDSYGRISRVTDPAMEVSLTYDDADRIAGWTATDTKTTPRPTLVTALTRDDLGREVQRTITGSHATWILTQTWYPNDLLKQRTLKSDSTTLRDESFTYNTRNQLTGYTCEGAALPQDEHSNPITRQTFTYDSFGNITQCETKFSTGSDTAKYSFENGADPCQLTKIEHTHTSYPLLTKLSYDAAGRLVEVMDGTGQKLTYDLLGRLESVSSGNNAVNRYVYDPLDRLLTQQAGDTISVLSYRRNKLASITEGTQHTRLLQLGQGCVAQHRTGDQPETRLLGTDGNRTVLVSSAGSEQNEYAYTVYGYRKDGAKGSVLGYDGERTDPALGWLHLGNGYRAYNPALMRFTAPDSLSPFGAGGINPYTYCLGDPVNRADPSGHLSWNAWLNIGIGIAGIVAAAFTAGASIAAAGGVMAAMGAASATSLVVGTLGAASDVTLITSGALEEASPKASSILGYVSMGTGLAGLGEMGARGAAWGIRRLARTAPATRVSTELRAGELGFRSQKATPFRPEIRKISNKQWKQKYEWDPPHANPSRPGGKVFVTKFETDAGKVADILDTELSKNPTGDFLLLSGTHGSPAMIRDSRYLDLGFFIEDTETVIQMRQKYPQATIHLRRMTRPEQVADTGLTADFSDYDVIIGGFCHSTNDSQLMPRLNLRPSTSYVTRSRWWQLW